MPTTDLAAVPGTGIALPGALPTSSVESRKVKDAGIHIHLVGVFELTIRADILRGDDGRRGRGGGLLVALL